ncbi:MAG: CoA transferase [Dehalococcoidia bacterium]
MDSDSAHPAALAGLRVLEIGDSSALAYAGKLLADFSADVVKVELPAGCDARRRIRLPGAPGADGALHRWIDSSKRSVVVDWERSVASLVPLLDGADVVISAVPSTAAGGPAMADALQPQALREHRPHLVVAHVSDFGPDGPLAGWRGGELVLYALSGLLGASGPAERPPVAHGTGVAWYTSGAALAVGVLVACWERERSGHGQVLDVAGLDAMIGAQAALPFVVSFTGTVLRRAGKTPRVELGVFPCSDGYIASVIGRDGYDRLLALLAEPELMEEKFLDRAAVAANLAAAGSIVARRFREESRDHWFHGAQALRMPFAKVQGARDLAECPQLAARGFIRAVEGPDGLSARLPSRPFVMGQTPWRMSRPAPLLGDTPVQAIGWGPRPVPTSAAPRDSRLPLSGIRVLELGTAWAAPCGTKILADLGADVLKIESPSHPDNARVGPYADDELTDRFYDRSPAYLIANTSKAHLALELSTPQGQEIFKRLVAGADVVFENYTPRVMRDFGLSYEDLRRITPGLIMLSSCGYGQTGPWSGYSAYGWSLEPGGGIADVTGYGDGPPVASAIPYPDMAGALHGAFAVMLALEHRRKTGEGQSIDLAQYELAALSGAAPLLQFLAEGGAWGRHGNRHPWYAPHNIYPSMADGTTLGATDAWVAIAVESDSEWATLVHALAGALADRPEWASFAGRKAAEDEIDAQIATWTRARTNAAAAEFLQGAGVRAAPVNRYDETVRNPQPWHRGQLVRAQHEESGVRIVPGPWQRFARTPARVRWAAPNFGAQNSLVLRGLLGLAEPEVAALYAAGVTADSPTGLARPAAAAIPLEQSVALGLARGRDPGYRVWNQAGAYVPLPDPLPFSWATVPPLATVHERQ